MDVASETFVTLLAMFCNENNFDPPVYNKLTTRYPENDSVVRVRVFAGLLRREAKATTEPIAREMAAKLIYQELQKREQRQRYYMPGVVTEQTGEFLHLQGAEDRPSWPFSQQQDVATVATNSGAKPTLIKVFEEHKRISAMEALNSTDDAELQITRAATALDLEVIWKEKPRKSGQTLISVELPNKKNKMYFAGFSRDEAASHLSKYLKINLLENKNDPALLE